MKSKEIGEINIKKDSIKVKKKKTTKICKIKNNAHK